MSKRLIGKFTDRAKGSQIKDGKSMVSLFCWMLSLFVKMTVIS